MHQLPRRHLPDLDKAIWKRQRRRSMRPVPLPQDTLQVSGRGENKEGCSADEVKVALSVTVAVAQPESDIGHTKRISQSPALTKADTSCLRFEGYCSETSSNAGHSEAGSKAGSKASCCEAASEASCCKGSSSKVRCRPQAASKATRSKKGPCKGAGHSHANLVPSSSASTCAETPDPPTRAVCWQHAEPAQDEMMLLSTFCALTMAQLEEDNEILHERIASLEGLLESVRHNVWVLVDEAQQERKRRARRGIIRAGEHKFEGIGKAGSAATYVRPVDWEPSRLRSPHSESDNEWPLEEVLIYPLPWLCIPPIRTPSPVSPCSSSPAASPHGSPVSPFLRGSSAPLPPPPTAPAPPPPPPAAPAPPLPPPAAPAPPWPPLPALPRLSQSPLPPLPSPRQLSLVTSPPHSPAPLPNLPPPVRTGMIGLSEYTDDDVGMGDSTVPLPPHGKESEETNVVGASGGMDVDEGTRSPEHMSPVRL
ncbi:hypothetical protein B0H21DRAFT_826352 [Amylocystis lapponica]|nr:hypothetical protein B0H21DRAFT_826352 [Amylocystis lapponica]